MPRPRSLPRLNYAEFRDDAFSNGPGIRIAKGRNTVLFPAASNPHIEADHAILIARTHNRNVPINVVLALDNLLRTLRYIGAVTESNVVRELLLDGDLRAARGWIGFRGQHLRIDLDPADSKKFLHAAAHRRVDRLVDDQGGCLVIEQTLAGLLLQLL